MEKLTIDKISVTTEYQGRVFTDRKGRKYAKVGIQFKEKGGQWWNALSYNETDPIRTWRVGNQVDVELEITPDKTDPNKQWHNIKMPRATDEMKARLDRAAEIIKNHEDRIKWLEDKIKRLINEAPPVEII